MIVLIDKTENGKYQIDFRTGNERYLGRNVFDTEREAIAEANILANGIFQTLNIVIAVVSESNYVD